MVVRKRADTTGEGGEGKTGVQGKVDLTGYVKLTGESRWLGS